MRKTVVTLLLLTTLTAVAQQKRDKAEYNAYIEAVDEYVPAPGQFVNTMPEYNDGDNAQTMAEKCSRTMIANSRDIKDDPDKGLICLGAYGGYITFHFDHSIANTDGADLKIVGNAFAETGNPLGGSSEPGIIMVSKDVNHNWLPDDPWYELSGSADVDSVGKVIYGYEITYHKDALKAVPWTDNQGGSGTIDRNTFHTQEYFPLWLGDELKLGGTLLPKSGVKSTTGWIQLFLRSGYVDNRPDDVLSDISNAVDKNRQPVSLDFVDFVRVYNCTNQQYPMIDETSTEIALAEDAHLDASLKASGVDTGISEACGASNGVRETIYEMLDGRIRFVRMADGSVKKILK